MSEAGNNFNRAHDFKAMSLKEMELYWLAFGNDLNECAIKISSPIRFKVHYDETGLGLIIEDRSRKDESLILTFNIYTEDSLDDYHLYSNLDPYMKVRTNDDPEPGTLCSVATFPKDAVSLQKMFNQCRAEILAGIGADLGYAYREHIEAKKGTAGLAGRVLN